MFTLVEGGEVRFLAWQPWLERGIEHGFTLLPQDFAEAVLETWGTRLCAALGAERLLIPKQVHGNVCVDLDSLPVEKLHGIISLGEADAVCFKPQRKSSRSIIGVRMADCVPLLLHGQSRSAVIHCGWRGIACGVVPGVVKKYFNRAEPLEIVIGPCAGPERYEVGDEVLEQLGNHVVYKRGISGRALLNLAETIRAQFVEEKNISWCESKLCSISDLRFHSVRRDGDRAGRGLGFILG